MKICEKIRCIREMKGISQEAIAKYLKISPQAFGKIERGETKFDYNKIDRIAEFLGVKTDDIINFSEETIFNKNISKLLNVESSDTKNDSTLYERLLKIIEGRFEKYELLVESNMKLIEKILEKIKPTE